MNAFTRMFMDPNKKKPTLMLSRVAAIPLFFFGVLWMAWWTYADYQGRTPGMPWWAGALTIAVGAVLYAINKASAGPVSVEISGNPQNVNVTNAAPVEVEPKP